MSTSAASGYCTGEPSGSSCSIDLHVFCVNGEGCVLSASPSTLGNDVRKMVSEKLPQKRGATCVFHHSAVPLRLYETLQEQGIAWSTTLSCTYVATDLYVAWEYVSGLSPPQADFALEGVTHIATSSVARLHHFPDSLESLCLGGEFNQVLRG